jgi:hypothetical protein
LKKAKLRELFREDVINRKLQMVSYFPWIALQLLDDVAADRRTTRRFMATAVLMFYLLSGGADLHAIQPQLWPTFSEPKAIVNVQFAGNEQSADDLVAITTLQGAYNQLQGSTRLYVSTGVDDPYWLSHAIPSNITVTNFPYTKSDPHGVLKAMSSSYGSSIGGYIVCDPIKQPESCNMAMTLAGEDNAMVVYPNNETVVSSYGLKKIADLTTYNWIGNNASLIRNATINMVPNPIAKDGGTRGWSCNNTRLSSNTFLGAKALQWTRATGAPRSAWCESATNIPDSRINTTPYIFSVQVAGSGKVFLDAYNGAEDIKSPAVTLSTASWQTLQLAVPIPLSGATGGDNAIQLEVRADSQSDATTVYFTNAAVIDNRVAIDTYDYNNYLLKGCCNKSILAQDFPTNYNLRDYQVAAKMFTFDLTQDYADEKALYRDIVSYTPKNTPVMGYVEDENKDVPYLSALGHFLNASDDYDNGSVWASLPQKTHLSQPSPIGIKVTDGTIYVGLTGSDGDNLSIIEHQMRRAWTDDQYLGAVPMGWTMSPGMIDNSPGIISNFYRFLPQSDEIVSATTGVGYTQSMTGSALDKLANDTKAFMNADDMSSVMTWDPKVDQSSTTTFASKVGAPHVVWSNPIPYSTHGSIPTVLDGQVVGYNANPQDQANAILAYVSNHYSSTAPNFIEALNDDLTFSQDDVLYIAQYLQNNGGHPYVFLTPSELARTEYGYYSHRGSSWPTNDAQAVAGTTLTTAYPANNIYNIVGREPNASITTAKWALSSSGHNESLIHTRYNGSDVEELHVPVGTDASCYGYKMLKKAVGGRYYRFTATVAGTGTAFMVVHDGTSFHIGTSVKLTSSFQTLSMTVLMQHEAGGQIQVALAPSSSAQTLYFSAAAATNPGWYYSRPGPGGAGTTSLSGANYNNGYFNAQAFRFNVPSGQGNSQSVNFYPTSPTPGATYIASVDVAGTGKVYVDFYDGGSDRPSSTVTLEGQWQTISTTATVNSSGVLVFEVVAPPSSSAQTIYFRNTSLVKAGSGGLVDFYTGLESGQTQLSWVDAVDRSPFGGESNVSEAFLQSSSTITHGGANAIHYGGTADSGSVAYAYMKALKDTTRLGLTSRLSYWIYPMTPLGQESGANSMTGLNSTCVAVDVVFTDGTTSRNLGLTDQFGNRLNPVDECDHLQPDQWNYVTANLSRLSGKTVSRIDIGYEQHGASGNYGGYVDDITLTH